MEELGAVDQGVAEFMRMAVDEARKSPPTAVPPVGVLLVRNGTVLAAGHKGEDGTGKHAEVAVLEKAASAGIDLKDSTAYVTLEPCSNIASKARLGCADLLANAGVTRVYIGRCDRNPRINRQGWKRLRDRGLQCLDFTSELRAELDRLTATFDGYFLRREGLSGVARFDFTQNGGRYELATGPEAGAQTWKTQWTTRGYDSIYAYGGRPGQVALARYAEAFSEIDDPDAYDYESSSAELAIGMIAIYRNEHGHALVQLLEVEPPPPYGQTPHVSVKIRYELRPYRLVGSVGTSPGAGVPLVPHGPGRSRWEHQLGSKR